MKEKLRDGFLLLLGIGLVAYFGITAIMDLTNTKDVKNVTLLAAANALQIEHSINGIIPVGTDYYYVGFDVNDNAYLMKASKRWYQKNFNSDYESVQPEGVTVKGLVKKISDFQTEKELENRLSELEGVEFPIGVTGCLQLDYIVVAILKLVDAFLVVALFFTGKYLFNEKEHVNSLYAKIWVVVMCLTLILMLGILR